MGNNHSSIMVLRIQPKSPRREVVRSSAGAGVVYPLFWGHSRSIPQGMIFDVQPLVKSLFCPIRQSPNGFFDSEASIPLNWILFFLRGGGGGGGVGSKVFDQKASSSGEADCCQNTPQLNGNAADCRTLGRRFESRLCDCRRRHLRHGWPISVQTADQKV